MAPIDLAENVRRDIVLNLEAMEFEVEASTTSWLLASMRSILSIRMCFRLRITL